ncbi:probable ubiquitin carboxyl-terminal hydrolase FAF-X [Onychomys torridus]|uniref:probable ubiquitin carboxyl-terminal hydrolase FAF-X n=1 Tax=Onychomys torridus TaxID=38674 RepID=UPI00167F42B1|nr:probable ubiquitin carboxyl-terminal hydrolase FAF-X [Onychomys torridus]
MGGVTRSPRERGSEVPSATQRMSLTSPELLEAVQLPLGKVTRTSYRKAISQTCPVAQLSKCAENFKAAPFRSCHLCWGLDVKSEACQRFFRDGLTISFTKILTDEAVSGWKFEIHRCIINNTHRLVELCVAKLAQDWFPLLELLAMALNPHCKFHIYNGTRPCESVSSSVQVPEDELFARSPDPRSPKGWLVDLLNKFGTLNGFQTLHDRFINGSALNVQIIAALIKPFGQCYEFLTLHTVKKYFLPIIEMVPQFLENLTDEELKKEAKNEAKNDALSMIIKSLKNLASRVPGQEETVKNLEIFRLKMILRLLQISSFNGKMNALNEVNKVISSVSYYTHRHGNPEEEEWLTAERMAATPVKGSLDPRRVATPRVENRFEGFPAVCICSCALKICMPFIPHAQFSLRSSLEAPFRKGTLPFGILASSKFHTGQ